MYVYRFSTNVTSFYTATVQRASAGIKKNITWLISDIPKYGYDIKNVDTEQIFLNLNGLSVSKINPIFRFLGDTKALTVEVEISNVSLEHGGYIVSADGSGVWGGTILAVQGSIF